MITNSTAHYDHSNIVVFKKWSDDIKRKFDEVVSEKQRVKVVHCNLGTYVQFSDLVTAIKVMQVMNESISKNLVCHFTKISTSATQKKQRVVKRKIDDISSSKPNKKPHL